MSYNKYNTRHSGRFNTPGQFVPPEQLAGGNLQRRIDNAQRPNVTSYNNTAVSTTPQEPQQFQPPPQSNMQPLQANDVEMKTEATSVDGSTADAFARPSWMKSKLVGVKKISNKERRRRQNAHLRRLLTPKNALMALNELLLNGQIPNDFKVEPVGMSQFYNQTPNNFCAELTVDGVVYKGFGETKIAARNAAAEKAIRDMMISKMNKIFNPEGVVSESSEEEEALPMIQLASFALHKLFTEWECDGHKVPQLKVPNASMSETDSLSGDTKMDMGEPRPKKKAKARELPANAASMHPCMLLTYMRPLQEYREISSSGDKPQNMIYTVGVEIDGEVYVGKAHNKKEARKAAARAACAALFNVTFNHNAAAAAPTHNA